MNIVLKLANLLPLELDSDPPALQLFLLGLAVVVLVGSMIMPALVYAGRKLVFLPGVAVRTIWRYIVDKIVESIIITLLTLLGGLWILDMFPAVFR